MKLKRVEIKGFKTIARKTVLEFPGAITCIAGPNGCGKSNVVDAIRWALGEQAPKSLRASAMGDIIFTGTQDTPSMSMASVTLDFMNDGQFFPKSLEGFNEFSISRKLFKDGESHYSINNVRCRLKDITDIFLDTGLDRQGYAIIEQGKVKDIIMSKPEDLRHILEEAAEVGKFRIKRTEAVKRLSSTKLNLERIKDLLDEIGKQRENLKAQAAKARRYQGMRDRLNELTRLSWSHEIGLIRAKENLFSIETNQLEEKIKVIQNNIIDEMTLLQTLERQLEILKRDIDEKYEVLSDARSRHALLVQERTSGQERLTDIVSTIDLLQNQINNDDKGISEVFTSIETLKAEIGQISYEIEKEELSLAGKKEHAEIQKVSYDTHLTAYEK